jgi:hypothetical protein
MNSNGPSAFASAGEDDEAGSIMTTIGVGVIQERKKRKEKKPFEPQTNLIGRTKFEFSSFPLSSWIIS